MISKDVPDHDEVVRAVWQAARVAALLAILAFLLLLLPI
jgi:hypothetical protein